MKKIIIGLLLIGSSFLQAQESKAPILDAVNAKTYVLLENQLVKGETVVSKIHATFGDVYDYSKDYRIIVNKALYYEMGEIKTDTQTYSVMFIQSKKANNSSQIEFLIVYKNENTKLESSELNAFRKNWMELCNTHQVEKLVTELYSPEAYYYNRGRLLKGNQAITKEYGYMKSPNYNLKLSPKHITMVNNTIAFELGRCSGSYPLPYLLVWQKQDDGVWKIALDSNY